MYIEGWAFKPNELELRDKNRARYKEIHHIAKDIELTKSPQYGRVRFSGILKSEEAKNLSPKDIALIADHGNLCFGGDCAINGDKFTGSYSTD